MSGIPASVNELYVCAHLRDAAAAGSSPFFGENSRYAMSFPAENCLHGPLSKSEDLSALLGQKGVRVNRMSESLRCFVDD